MIKKDLALAEDLTQGFSIKVAASNASDESKAVAKYICDGVNDDVELNAAVQELPNGGCIELSEGTFNGGISLSSSNIWVKGQGNATVFDGDIVVNIGVKATLSDLKITGGEFDGVLNMGILNIFNCNISEGTGYDGIYNQGEMILIGNTITKLNTSSNILPSTTAALQDVNKITTVTFR